MNSISLFGRALYSSGKPVPHNWESLSKKPRAGRLDPWCRLEDSCSSGEVMGVRHRHPIVI